MQFHCFPFVFTFIMSKNDGPGQSFFDIRTVFLKFASIFSSERFNRPGLLDMLQYKRKAPCTSAARHAE